MLTTIVSESCCRSAPQLSGTNRREETTVAVVLPSLPDPIFSFSFITLPCFASVLWSLFSSSASRQHECESFSEHSPVPFCLLFVLAPGHFLLVYNSVSRGDELCSLA